MMKYLLFIVVLFMVGCTVFVPPQDYDFENSQVINKNYDETMRDVLRFFSQHKMSIIMMDYSLGYIEAGLSLEYLSNGAALDCGTIKDALAETPSEKKERAARGGQWLPNVSASEANVVVHVYKTSENTSKVWVYLLYNQSKIKCVSNGKLEALLFWFISG